MVLFDFVTDCARVHFPENDLQSESIRNEIPFVPEQIREITVRYETKESKILVSFMVSRKIPPYEGKLIYSLFLLYCKMSYEIADQRICVMICPELRV